MWETTPSRILLAIDQDPLPMHVGLVADEARRRGCGVHLVHVEPLGRDEYPLAGMAMLHTAEVGLRRLLGDVLPVSTELCRGPVVGTLVAESAFACVVVVGSDLGDPPGSAAGRIAARSDVPTLVLPARHVGGRTSVRRLVTVAVEDVESARPAVLAAIEEAERRHAGLRILHVAGGSSVVAVPDWTALVISALATSYDDLLASHPRVGHELVVATGEPAQVLLRHAARSDLLVMGRGEPALCWPGGLGPTARTVLAHPPCPVLVVGVSSQVRGLVAAVLP